MSALHGGILPSVTARAMARAVFDDWRLANASGEFRRWLEQGAPSDDVLR